MLYFCTLFDSFYLSKGLAMYESLKKHISDFHLYIIAFDDLSYSILGTLKPDHTTLISLREFEDPELLSVKEDRTKAEYCWTCTPSVIDYVLSKYGLPQCIYLDADLMFYNSPALLINEMVDQSSVLITEHRYSPVAKIYEKERAGRFCVQFIVFNQSFESRKILAKWKDQCIDWCYNRYENGKFGDQKYLDAWPKEYRHVHILNHPGGGIAPWNVQQYRIIEDELDMILIDKKTHNTYPLIFYHFQYVKFLGSGYVDIGWHFIPGKIKKTLYLPYIQKLLRIEKQLSMMDSNFETYYGTFGRSSPKDILKMLTKKISRFNLIRYERD